MQRDALCGEAEAAVLVQELQVLRPKFRPPVEEHKGSVGEYMKVLVSPIPNAL